jgi:hypothetical protein
LLIGGGLSKQMGESLTGKPINALPLKDKLTLCSGQAVEMGVGSLRLELEDTALPYLDMWRRTKPLVGLLLNREGTDFAPSKLLALVQSVEVLPNPGKYNQNCMVLELTFPEPLRQRQENKIKQVMRQFGVY